MAPGNDDTPPPSSPPATPASRHGIAAEHQACAVSFLNTADYEGPETRPVLFHTRMALLAAEQHNKPLKEKAIAKAKEALHQQRVEPDDVAIGAQTLKMAQETQASDGGAVCKKWDKASEHTELYNMLTEYIAMCDVLKESAELQAGMAAVPGLAVDIAGALQAVLAGCSEVKLLECFSCGGMTIVRFAPERPEVQCKECGEDIVRIDEWNDLRVKWKRR